MTEIKNIPASISARLQNLARLQNKPYQEILQYYGIERFLFRLYKTRYAERFVLKGGLVFYLLGILPRRPTRDIDFRGFIQNSTEQILEVIESVFKISCPEDGLVFRSETIRFEQTMVDSEYNGIRVQFEILLGKSIIPIQIDIGFSDVILPTIKNDPYPILLAGMDSPLVRRYPLESIISEKFHAMVRLETINSRWKDFYDLWLLSEEIDLNGKDLKNALIGTFEQRETPIPTTLPVALSDSYAEVSQTNWTSFLTRNRLGSVKINEFSSVIGRLRSLLMPLINSIHESTPFNKRWLAGKDWF